MKKIPLSGELGEGKFALVDDEDYEYLSQFKWYLNNGYAYRTGREELGEPKAVLMHREVMNAPKGLEVDHIDSNRLNNTRSNLRLATRGKNGKNIRKYKGVHSKYKGVTKTRAKYRPWQAAICVDGVDIYIGSFATEIEAAKAYNEKAKELFGEFAKLNDLPDDIQPSSVPTKSQMNGGKRPAKNSSSKYKGVTRTKGKWQAAIKFQGKNYYLGLFDTEEEAAFAYNEKAKDFFGECAYLNPIPEDFVPPKKEKKKKFRGVFFNKGVNKWTAYIQHKGEQHYLGIFDSEIEAAKAYNAKALELHGDKAKLNIIPEEVEND